MVEQHQITLPAYPRGFHLITHLIEDNLPTLPEMGILHLFIQHTSAGLSINENADPSVRYDFEQIFNRMVPENQPYYTHTMEGSDDMPAHIKASLTQTSIAIPVSDSRLALGTWQGIYLFEHRAQPHTRRVVAHLGH